MITLTVNHYHHLAPCDPRAHEAIIHFLADIKKQLNTIMATEAEIIADLKAVTAQQTKTLAEIKSVQDSVDVLKVKITELEAIIAAGATPSAELVAAVAEVKAQAQLVDDQIPDIVVPPAE